MKPENAGRKGEMLSLRITTGKASVKIIYGKEAKAPAFCQVIKPGSRFHHSSPSHSFIFHNVMKEWVIQ